MSLVIETLTLLVDIGILWVLLIEFNYDKIQDEKREYKEAQKKRKKAVVTQSISSISSSPHMEMGQKQEGGQ